MNEKEEKSYLIVGLGRFGTALCEKLASLGQNVIGVDDAAAPVAEIADKISVAAQMDVTDEASLIKIGAKEVDVAVVTIGEAVEPSVLCTSLLVELGVPTVIARASNRLHARVLERVGAHKVISPEYDMGARIGEALVYPWYSSFTRIGGSDFVIGKIPPLPEMIGRSMAELKFSQKYKVIVILMEYDGKQHIPDPMRPIEEGDMLWVQGTVDGIDALIGRDS
ncbi:TrkA family potassium uptake protein [Cloacibacillus sp. An23]|uniref:potassium channel family protein n=1 Tax=Cloacibacillus sp. An23 TaxID=1965591 RepID=UPI000B38F7C3|nr:TrkA family potassium uptake protein [Cloacibacillus sp. An23]OUO95244.1 potassium transporter KtrA [Cloacibacillus sp. An23]